MDEERPRIVYDLDPEEQPKSVLDEEREKHRQRAERFGTQYKDPAKLPKFAQEARKERFKREGFATGIDLFSEEEIAKRAARAKKFGLPEERQQVGYAPDPEDLKREARAKKFGVKYEKPTAETLLQKADLFEPRKDAPEDIPRREEAIYLYGVDLMSSKDCLSYFDEYGPTQVEWINDSSCCVVFADAATARRAIAGCGHPLTAEELSSAPDSMDETMTELDPSAMIPYLWHKGRDFVKGLDANGKEIKIPLMYRMATDLDQKDPHAEKRSRYLWQGKRRREEGYQQEQQQHGKGRGRERGRSRRQQQARYEEGWEEGEYGVYGEADMQEQQGGRRGRGSRRVRQRKHANGDADMEDVQDAAAATAAAAAAAGGGGGGANAGELEGDAKDLREMLKQRNAQRIAEEEDLPWDEVEQPDTSDLEED